LTPQSAENASTIWSHNAGWWASSRGPQTTIIYAAAIPLQIAADYLPTTKTIIMVGAATALFMIGRGRRRYAMSDNRRPEF
jgi:hypothetical protein